MEPHSQQDAATGAQPDATPPAPTDSTTTPADTAVPEGAAPTPPAEADADMRQKLQERESTIGRQGSHLDTLSRENEVLRAQLAATETAPPDPAAPVGNYNDLLLSDNPGAAFDQFKADLSPQIEARAEEIAEQKAQQAVQGLRMQIEFQRIAPDLIGNEVAVEQATRDLGDSLRTMNPEAALDAIAVRARELLTANVSQEAAPTPPPVASATAPSQAPQAPGADAPQTYDAAKAAAADRQGLLARQQKQKLGSPIKPIP